MNVSVYNFLYSYFTTCVSEVTRHVSDVFILDENYEKPVSSREKKRNRVYDSSDDESSESSSEEITDEEVQPVENDKSTGSVSGYTFISVLVDLLDDEVSEVHAVEDFSLVSECSIDLFLVRRCSFHSSTRIMSINGHWKA